jgi:hypothetical protein
VKLIVTLVNPWWFGLKKQVVRPVEHSLWVRELLGIGFPVCWASGC